MTYWDEKKDSHIKFWNTEIYESYWSIKSEINDDGYRCDRLQPSNVLYLGTCDIMTNFRNEENRWSKLLHNKLYQDQPFIAIGSVASGLQTMVRRLYSYIENYNAPRILYITIPRFDSYEFVNSSGNCYSVSTRTGSAHFCRRANLINDEDHIVWMAQLDANKKLKNRFNMQYLIEERFAFIETICRLHNIELKWTFNPSDASILMLYENLDGFKNISKFMKNSFVGLPLVKDHVYDRSIGPETHKEIYHKFIDNEKWDYNRLCEIAEHNYKWSFAKYNTEIIKMENE